MMIEASISGALTILVTFDGPISEESWGESDFVIHPSDTPSDGVDQVSANVLEIIFPSAVAGNTTLVNQGSVAGVRSPQTIALT